MKNLKAVVELLHRNNHQLVLLSDDEEISNLARKVGAKVHFRLRSSFWAWSQLDAIRRAMQNRMRRFSVPEFFSPEYVSLQLCKFQALSDLSITTLEPVIWIDAGLKEWMLPEKPLLSTWSHKGIHVTQFSPTAPCEAWVTELPGAFLMGGCFGGFGPDVRRLYTASQSLLKELWAKGMSANDQQVLSLLYLRAPDMFHVQKAFTSWIPFVGSGRWDKVLDILTSETDEFHKDLRWIGLSFLVLCLTLATHKNAS